MNIFSRILTVSFFTISILSGCGGGGDGTDGINVFSIKVESEQPWINSGGTITFNASVEFGVAGAESYKVKITNGTYGCGAFETKDASGNTIRLGAFESLEKEVVAGKKTTFSFHATTIATSEQCMFHVKKTARDKNDSIIASDDKLVINVVVNNSNQNNNPPYITGFQGPKNDVAEPGQLNLSINVSVTDPQGNYGLFRYSWYQKCGDDPIKTLSIGQQGLPYADNFDIPDDPLIHECTFYVLVEDDGGAITGDMYVLYIVRP